jgi:hypothetical protein
MIKSLSFVNYLHPTMDITFLILNIFSTFAHPLSLMLSKDIKFNIYFLSSFIKVSRSFTSLKLKD